MRPRIRTLKPEIWSDEKIGRVSREARLLFVGLITLADDEGRFRALPSAILGHVFPYDTDAPRRLAGWMDELTRMRLVVVYETAGVAYGHFPHWSDHQRINRASDSILPAPPLMPHDSISEPSVRDHGGRGGGSRPRAQARAAADQDQGSTTFLHPYVGTTAAAETSAGRSR